MKLENNQMEIYLSGGFASVEKGITCLKFLRPETIAEASSSYSKNSKGFKELPCFYRTTELLSKIPNKYFIDTLFFDKDLVGCVTVGEFEYIESYGNNAKKLITKLSILNSNGEVIDSISLV